MTTIQQDIIDAVRSAATTLANARMAEMLADDVKPVRKMDAIARIMASGDNPLTGKPYSESAAEKAVEADAEYAAYLALRRESVGTVIRARAEYEVACAILRGASV